MSDSRRICRLNDNFSKLEGHIHLTRNMIIFLKIISWLGIGFVIPGLFCSFSASYNDLNYPGMTSSGVGYFVAMCFGAFAVILSLVCGLISKPRFFWIGCIIIGIIYIASFYGWFLIMIGGRWIETVGLPKAILGTISCFLPGVLFIFEGVILTIISKRQKRSAHS